MAMPLEEAVSIANKIRGTNGQYTFPHEQSVGDLAEAMQTLKVGLQRYRTKVVEFRKDTQAIEEGE